MLHLFTPLYNDSVFLEYTSHYIVAGTVVLWYTSHNSSSAVGAAAAGTTHRENHEQKVHIMVFYKIRSS
jgi:hypothetical protein